MTGNFFRRNKPSLEDRITAHLATVGEAFGLEIREALDVGPRVYGTLRSMEARGVLFSEERPGPPERGDRPRIYYRLNPALAAD